ncbi:MAG: LPS export ABC transporter periplasmic protein LptC [Pontibacterium sp.]
MLSARTRLIAAALLLGPVLLYWGLALTPGERRGTTPEALLQGQDYFALNTQTRIYNEQGNLSQQLDSPRLDHYPQQAINVFQTPEILLTDEDGSTTHINALKGTLPDTQSKVILAGNVRVQDNAISGLKTDISTERLTLYPETKFAETTEPVTIISDKVRYDAVGMKASLKARTLQLLSNVQGLHKNEK